MRFCNTIYCFRVIFQFNRTIIVNRKLTLLLILQIETVVVNVTFFDAAAKNMLVIYHLHENIIFLRHTHITLLVYTIRFDYYYHYLSYLFLISWQSYWYLLLCSSTKLLSLSTICLNLYKYIVCSLFTISNNLK